MHKSTIYLSDKEYSKLREMAFKEKKSMAAIIRQRLGFLSDMVNTLRAVNSEGEHMLSKVPTTPHELETLKQNIPDGLTSESWCEHMKKYKDCDRHGD